MSSILYTSSSNIVSSDWTLMFFIKDVSIEDLTLFSAMDDDLVDNKLSLTIENNFAESKVNVNFIYEDGTYSAEIDSVDLSDGDWYHFAFVCNENDSIDIYLNGEFNKSIEPIASTDIDSTNYYFGQIFYESLLLEDGGKLLLEDGGALLLESDEDGDSSLYDFRLYSKALSANAIAFYYDDVINNNGDVVLRYGNA
jgi:hypothetical protein